MNIPGIVYNADGLVPCIVQDAGTLEVLMMAWMSEESLALTLERGIKLGCQLLRLCFGDFRRFFFGFRFAVRSRKLCFILSAGFIMLRGKLRYIFYYILLIITLDGISEFHGILACDQSIH